MSRKRNNNARRKLSAHQRQQRADRRYLIGTILIGRESYGLDSDGEPCFSVHHRDRNRERKMHKPEKIDQAIDGKHTWRVTVFAEGFRPDSKRKTPDLEATVFEAPGIRVNELQPLCDPEIEVVKKIMRDEGFLLSDWGWKAEIIPRKQERVA